MYIFNDKWNDKIRNSFGNESTFKLGQIDQKIVLILKTNCKSVLKMAITHTKHSICRLLSGFYCNLATPLLIYEVLQTNCSTVTKLPHNGMKSILKYCLVHQWRSSRKPTWNLLQRISVKKTKSVIFTALNCP